ncbi:unnamed protein product [Protopolystoma xenopodis]|uniref:Uncharacterized protein n=1 Tax=Protopolystoma xenopodis TaxID=117903 RepID=A0A3S5CJD7_9PLAT|nr:unnamed protein product [Protopolystoma xenopodis]
MHRDQTGGIIGRTLAEWTRRRSSKRGSGRHDIAHSGLRQATGGQTQTRLDVPLTGAAGGGFGGPMSMVNGGLLRGVDGQLVPLGPMGQGGGISYVSEGSPATGLPIGRLPAQPVKTAHPSVVALAAANQARRVGIATEAPLGISGGGQVPIVVTPSSNGLQEADRWATSRSIAALTSLCFVFLPAQAHTTICILTSWPGGMIPYFTMSTSSTWQLSYALASLA